MKKHFSVILSILTAVIVGCGSSNDFNQISGQQGNSGPSPRPTPTTTVTPSPPAAPVANLRIVNTSADNNNFSVSVDGTVVDSDLDRLESTPYLELEPGSHTVTVSNAGTGDSRSTTVNLARDSYSSVVYVPSFSDNVRAQGLEFPSVLVTLPDDVTPVAQQLNARLFNAFMLESTCTLFDDGDNLLLGPVAQLAATTYRTIAASAAQSEFYYAKIDLTGDGFIDGVFATELDNDLGFVDTIRTEVGLSGLNMSVFITHSQVEKRLYALVLLDEAGDGSRAIRSQGQYLDL